MREESEWREVKERNKVHVHVETSMREAEEYKSEVMREAMLFNISW